MTETSRPETGHPVLAATPARQGRYGRHMFWVLVAGTALAALGLFAAWTWKAPAFSAADAKIDQTHAAAAPTYSQPQPNDVVQSTPTPQPSR